MGSNFQTEVEIPVFEWKTGYKYANLFIGSCFTENIGGKMASLKYKADINPFGILYNPISVANGLRFLLTKRAFSKEDLIQHDGLWHSFFHHSRFSSPDMHQTLNTINNKIKASSHFLKNARFLFITFGTAWVFEYKKTGNTVSNCHKIPPQHFKRYRLTGDEIIEEFLQLVPELWKVNPELKIVFTVSPIRHLKDGAIENQRSKATLVLAIDQLVRKFGTNRCTYFPAYEIVMDELRDYRFYSEDMVHLSDVAIKHIWNIFQISLIENESQKISNEVQKIINAKNHKPFNIFTAKHLLFLKKSIQKIKALKKNYSYLDLALEENYFSEQIDEIEAKRKHF